MHSALGIEQVGVTEQIPLAVDFLARDLKDGLGCFGAAGDARLTEGELVGCRFPGPQPEQAIEGRQGFQVNQRGIRAGLFLSLA